MMSGVISSWDVEPQDEKEEGWPPVSEGAS